MHPKFAERIASNLSTVKRLHGEKEASKWWETRFSHLGQEAVQQVLEVLRRRSGKK